MVEKGVAGSAGKFVMWNVFAAEAASALFDLRWMLALVVVLIVADFWFGVSESLKKREQFRFSRAGRRTCGKAIDYLTYLLLGSVLGMAIFEPLGWATHVTTAAIGLGLGCIWEIDSIVGHVCALHGVENRFSVKRFVIFLIKQRYQQMGKAIEESIGKDDEGGKK